MTINSLQPTVFSRQLQEVFENLLGNTQAKHAALLTAESRKPKADERIDKMDTEKQEKTEVKVHFLSIDRSTGAPIVVLKEKESEANRILLIWIGESEAAAIQMHLENIEFPRPMTHDLLKTMIETFDAKVADVCVNAVEQADERWTFYAHLTVNMNGETVQVDCRPSDAIALAIRCEVPIYVAEDVIAGHGFSEQELGTGQKDDTKDVLENLDDDTLKQFTV